MKKKKCKKQIWKRAKYLEKHENVIHAEFSTKMGHLSVWIEEQKGGKFTYDAYLTESISDEHIVYCKKKDRENSLETAKIAVFDKISEYTDELVNKLEEKTLDVCKKIAKAYP